MFIYPENLKAKPMLWLWLLRDIAVIGIGALLSVLAACFLFLRQQYYEWRLDP